MARAVGKEGWHLAGWKSSKPRHTLAKRLAKFSLTLATEPVILGQGMEKIQKEWN